jgi:hypothetical protein
MTAMMKSLASRRARSIDSHERGSTRKYLLSILDLLRSLVVVVAAVAAAVVVGC